jgi:hypothetical protein
MSTLDYFTQPDYTPSRMRLLATDLLIITDNDSAKTIPSLVLRKKLEILREGGRFFHAVKSGYDGSGQGIHKVACSPESIKTYKKFSQTLGAEAKDQFLPRYIDACCVTLGKLIEEIQPSPEEITKTRVLLKRIVPDYDKASKTSRIEPSQSSQE